ncbi:MAG: hypothetical protein KDJ38_17205 [Gammaproteobacteria bacterium]|nr:hypothetical protein [Gammaproteobacteria bacterium]
MKWFVLCCGLLSGLAVLADECDIPPARLIVDALLDKRFATAEKTLQDWQAGQPDSLQPGFYAASITLARAQYVHGDDYTALNDHALEQLAAFRKQVTGKKTVSAEDELLLGMSEAFSARIFLDRKEWLKAYSIGRQARDRLRALIEKNPQQQDAYLVLGLYEFYTGDVPVMLKWLTTLIDLSGNRQRGLDWLQRAVEHGRTAAPEAARILVEELALKAPEVCQWLVLNKTLRETYPANPRLAYALQKNYRLCGFPDQALQENLRASRQFRGDRRMVSRLIGQRLLIFRDLGDTKSMRALQAKFVDPAYFEKRLNEGRHVAGERDGKAYSAPAPVHNTHPLTIKPACDAG